MNLLELLKQEVAALGLENKVDIANYLYMRTGQIFEYDPLWGFADNIEREEIKNKEIDIENVTDFYVVCFSWSRMFKKLLEAFSINAKIKSSDGTHACVVAQIEGKNYCFDLTKDYEDLMLIKFGMHPLHNSEIMKDKDNSKKEMSVYFDEQNYSLKKLKFYFEEKRAELHLSDEDYLYVIFKWISKKVDFSHQNVGYISGNTYIYYLLKYFMGENYKPCYSNFYDKNSGTFIRIYATKRRGKLCYFSYQPMEGQNFGMKEINTLEEIKSYLSLFSVEKPYNLVLHKKNPASSIKVA